MTKVCDNCSSLTGSPDDCMADKNARKACKDQMDCIANEAVKIIFREEIKQGPLYKSELCPKQIRDKFEYKIVDFGNNGFGKKSRDIESHLKENKMIKGKIVLSVYDYGNTSVALKFKLGGHEWVVKNQYYFSSPKEAGNQAKKLAEKFGITIMEIEYD